MILIKDKYFNTYLSWTGKTQFWKNRKLHKKVYEKKKCI